MALIYCEMTTGPDGLHLPVGQRLAEIRARYGPGDAAADRAVQDGSGGMPTVQEPAQDERVADDGCRGSMPAVSMT